MRYFHFWRRVLCGQYFVLNISSCLPEDRALLNIFGAMSFCCVLAIVLCIYSSYRVYAHAKHTSGCAKSKEYKNSMLYHGFPQRYRVVLYSLR